MRFQAPSPGSQGLQSSAVVLVVSRDRLNRSDSDGLPVLASTTAATPSTDLDPRPRRWTREEFYRMAELGWFHGERAEAHRGRQLMVLSPQGPTHSYFTDQVAELLRNSGWTGVWVRIQFPIDFGPYSDPKPDVSVVMGSRADDPAAHPSSCSLDRGSECQLSPIYDRAARPASAATGGGVADYWIVNVNDDQLEVYRDPGADLAQPFGYGYASLTVDHRGESGDSSGSSPPVLLRG